MEAGRVGYYIPELKKETFLKYKGLVKIKLYECKENSMSKRFYVQTDCRKWEDV